MLHVCESEFCHLIRVYVCASVRLEWILDQLGRHVNIVIIIIIIMTAHNSYNT